MNPIVPQSACDFCTSLPVSRLLLPAPKPRLMLSAPKIAGYLPAPRGCAAGGYVDSSLRCDTTVQAGGYMDSPLQRNVTVEAGVSIVPVKAETRAKRVVEAEIANPLLLINIYKDPDAWLEAFDRIYGPSQTIEEMDAEIEAKYPGWIKLKESWS